MSERCVRASGLLVIAAAWVMILSLFTRGAAPTIFASRLAWPDAEAIAVRASAQFSPTAWVYLPVVMSLPSGPVRRVNAPYFSGAVRPSEAAIFWFGRVNSSENYADVRVGYDDTELYVQLAAFDRRLWYSTTPTPGDLATWDAATLYLDLDGNAGSTPDANAYRFVGQLNWWEPRTSYQAVYRGNGSSWVMATVPFNATTGWRGDAPNNNGDDRGWVATFQIPFTSLGLSGPPSQGTVWGMAMTLHDRDSSTGPSLPDKTWPEAMIETSPHTWGQVTFGLPVYTPPQATPGGTVTIRHKLNGATVQDAAAGGYTLCGAGTDFWTQWGDTNESFYDSEHSLFNVQNQSDISDWPCFSKYYVTFPLDAVPSGKAILSATLMLHQMGNAGDINDPNPDNRPKPSLIQVLTVAEDWSEVTLTWNNAPLALENVGQAWVQPIQGCGAPGGISWPCVSRTWDVSYAVARAYAAGQPLRLALYSADSDYHSGKYFTSSETGDWNEAGRPTLQVLWGNP
jgi:hypothetical protein